MSKYTSEQVEEMASDLRGAPWTSMIGTHISLPADKAVAMYEVLCAFAATLRQQGEQAGGMVSDGLTSTEALFGFMGWLTSRDSVSGPFSAHHDASQAVELIGKFAEANHLPNCRNEWTNHLVHPVEAAAPSQPKESK